MGREKLQRYYNQKRVGSYGGVAALRRFVPDQDVERWLSEQDAYTLHKPVRRRFKNVVAWWWVVRINSGRLIQSTCRD